MLASKYYFEGYWIFRARLTVCGERITKSITKRMANRRAKKKSDKIKCPQGWALIFLHVIMKCERVCFCACVSQWLQHMISLCRVAFDCACIRFVAYQEIVEIATGKYGMHLTQIRLIHNANDINESARISGFASSTPSKSDALTTNSTNWKFQ